MQVGIASHYARAHVTCLPPCPPVHPHIPCGLAHLTTPTLPSLAAPAQPFRGAPALLPTPQVFLRFGTPALRPFPAALGPWLQGVAVSTEFFHLMLSTLMVSLRQHSMVWWWGYGVQPDHQNVLDQQSGRARPKQALASEQCPRRPTSILFGPDCFGLHHWSVWVSRQHAAGSFITFSSQAAPSSAQKHDSCARLYPAP